MKDEMKRMNKGFMRKDGKFFLPITHESLVVDNDGVSISKKYLSADGLAGYATEDYVREAILNAQLDGAEVDLSKYATIEQLNEKADKSDIPLVDVDKSYVDEQIEGHTHDEYATEQFVEDKLAKIDLSTSHVHENKAVLDTISLADINRWDSKSDFSGSFKDLTDVPEMPDIEDMATQAFVLARMEEVREEIPTVDVNKAYVDEQLKDKAHRVHKHDYEDIIGAPKIPSIEGLATEQFVLDEIAKVQVGDDVDLSGYAKLTDLDSKADKSEIPSIDGLASEEYVDEKIAEIEIPECEQYDDSEIVSRITALEAIDHNQYLTEHQDVSHLASKDEIPSVEGLASEDFVNEKIAAIEFPECEKYDDSELVSRVESLEQVDHNLFLTEHQDISHLATKAELHQQANFSYRVEMVSADQTAGFEVTGQYPNLVITLKLPEYSISVPEDTKAPMYVGFIPFDQAAYDAEKDGTMGFTNENDISLNMDMRVIQFGLNYKSLVALEAEALGRVNVTDLISHSSVELASFLCVIAPKTSNIVAYLDNGVGEKLTFAQIHSDDGSSGYMYCQNGGTLSSKINGVDYVLYGTYITTAGQYYIHIENK